MCHGLSRSLNRTETMKNFILLTCLSKNSQVLQGQEGKAEAKSLKTISLLPYRLALSSAI